MSVSRTSACDPRHRVEELVSSPTLLDQSMSGSAASIPAIPWRTSRLSSATTEPDHIGDSTLAGRTGTRLWCWHHPSACRHRQRGPDHGEMSAMTLVGAWSPRVVDLITLGMRLALTAGPAHERRRELESDAHAAGVRHRRGGRRVVLRRHPRHGWGGCCWAWVHLSRSAEVGELRPLRVAQSGRTRFRGPAWPGSRIGSGSRCCSMGLLLLVFPTGRPPAGLAWVGPGPVAAGGRRA